MAETLDLILVAVSIAGGAALFVYKLVLMYRYRGDPEKLKALVWSDQVYPKRLQRFFTTSLLIRPRTPQCPIHT